MRALWLAAPLALTRHLAVFVAVVTAVALAAGAAASTPFVRAGVKSAALRGQVRSMSPLAAGLEIGTHGTLDTDVARRQAAVTFGRAHGLFTGRPVVASTFPALVASNGLNVVAMARTDASAHVTHFAGNGNSGVWISQIVAKTAQLHPGDVLRLTEFGLSTARPPVAQLRIAGVYAALDGDLGNPYWQNWVQQISTRNPNDSPLPTFVLMPERTLLRVARELKVPGVVNTFEFPVDASHITYVRAEHLSHTYTELGRALTSHQSGVGRGMNCGGPRSCNTSSSISSALLIAGQQVDEVSTTITLLSACALAIAALISAAAGVFLVRRRYDEAYLLFSRGEGPASFALRTALEAVLPTGVGLAAGFGSAVAALTLFAAAGTLDHGTLVAGALDATAAAVGALALVALASLAAFPRLPHNASILGRLRAVPWEVVPLAAAGVLVGLLLSGSALARDAQGHTHPRLIVFLLPAVAAAGLASLIARATRRLAQRRGTNAALPLFLVLRRIAAARALLVAVTVSAATAFAIFVYAQTLSSSVSRTAAEKAFVANGSDVQGLIDPTERIYQPFSFPATTAQVDSTDVFVKSRPLVLVAGDPAALANVLVWGNWPDDPRTRLPKLVHAADPPNVLPVIASPNFPNVSAIVDQGVSLPIHVVARAPIPGSLAGWPAVLADARRFHAVTQARHVADPSPDAGAVIWARGDPRVIEPALARSSLRPSFMTMLSVIRSDPSVVAAARSYRYLRAIGIAAVVLAVAGLLLYLQARQRGQRLASALLRRMNVRAGADMLTLALEASAIAAGASVVGGLVAIGAARLVVPRVDPLAQYAPGTSFVYPWTAFLLVGAAIAATAGAFAAVAVGLALRANVAEELRVA